MNLNLVDVDCLANFHGVKLFLLNPKVGELSQKDSNLGSPVHSMGADLRPILVELH